MTAYDDPWLSDDERRFFNKVIDDQRRLLEQQLLEAFLIPCVTQPEPTKERAMDAMFEMTIEKNEAINGWYALQRYMAAPEYDFVVLEPATAIFALNPAMFAPDTVLAVQITEATVSGRVTVLSVILFTEDGRWVGYKSEQTVPPGITLVRRGDAMHFRISSHNFRKGKQLRIVVSRVSAEPLNALEEAEADPGVDPGV
jgi:hypothetical protein